MKKNKVHKVQSFSRYDLQDGTAEQIVQKLSSVVSEAKKDGWTDLVFRIDVDSDCSVGKLYIDLVLEGISPAAKTNR